MKSNQKPSYHSSPYPLKALEEEANKAEGPQASHLIALLSEKSKTTGRSRVYSMTNPYKSKPTGTPPRRKNPKNAEPDGKDWFSNYE